MKVRIFIVLFIAIASCSKSQNLNKLPGSWKLRDVVDQTGKNAYDKVTFLKNGSVTIELFANQKLVSKLDAKYKLNLEHKTLEMDYENYSFTFNVLKLDDQDMELENQTTKRIDRYIRF